MDCHFSESQIKTISTSAAQSYAFSRLSLLRSWAQLPHYDLLFPISSTQDCHWGNDKQVGKKEKLISQHTISEHVTPVMPSVFSRRHDEKYMASFLENTSMEDLVFNESLYTRRQLLPNFCSLLDYITVDSNRLDTWNVAENQSSSARELFESFQKYKGLSLKLLDQVKVKELWIGRDSEEKVREVCRWAAKQWGKDQAMCPTGVISMDLEAIQILKSDLEKVLESAKMPKPLPVPIENLNCKKIKKGTATQLPVRIMVGNGYSWALMLTLLTQPSSDGRLKVDPPKFQRNMVSFLKVLPTAVGVGIQGDVKQILELIHKTSDPTFQFKYGCVDVSAMAVLAGWNFPFHNMQALSVQALGAVLNKSVSCGDGKWGLKWEHIPAPLQVYCLGDIKFGHLASTLFLTILLRDLFPDPDIVLSFTRSDGHKFMTWFTSWIADILQDVEVSPGALSGALTRLGAIYSLRNRQRDGKLSSQPPSRVEVFSQLLGSWPSITYGGPRYLHQVRRHFLVQCQVFYGAQVAQWKVIMPWEISLKMEVSATYALPGLSQLDYTVGTALLSRGLGVHPDLRHLVLPGENLSSQAVEMLARDYQRVRREVVYEWLRLNLGEVQRFVDQVGSDTYYSKWKGSYLLEMQMIVHRSTGTPGPDLSRTMVSSVVSRNKRWLDKEVEELEKARQVVAQRQKRVEHFKFWGSDEWTKRFSSHSWRGEIPRVAPNRPSATRMPSFLEDFQPVEYMAERQTQVENDPEAYPVCLRRERDEMEPQDRYTQRPKKRKASAPAVSQDPVPIWQIEDNESFDMSVDNTITDAELMGAIE